MVKTIIFDFNGTLLDDLEINFEIFNLLAHDFNAREISLNEYLEVFDFPVIDCYRKWGFEVDDGKFTPIADRFHQYYNERVFERCKIFDSAYKLLEELKGKYRLVCLSATKKQPIQICCILLVRLSFLRLLFFEEETINNYFYPNLFHYLLEFFSFFFALFSFSLI